MNDMSFARRFCIAALLTLLFAGCGSRATPAVPATSTASSPEEDVFTDARLELVEKDRKSVV